MSIGLALAGVGFKGAALADNKSMNVMRTSAGSPSAPSFGVPEIVTAASVSSLMDATAAPEPLDALLSVDERITAILEEGADPNEAIVPVVEITLVFRSFAVVLATGTSAEPSKPRCERVLGALGGARWKEGSGLANHKRAPTAVTATASDTPQTIPAPRPIVRLAAAVRASSSQSSSGGGG